MNSTAVRSTAYAIRSEFAASHAKIAELIERGTPVALTWDTDAAIVDAYVTSATAVRMLKPLGRDAVGKFRALPGNMVAIEAIVTHDVAIKMMAAYHPAS